MENELQLTSFYYTPLRREVRFLRVLILAGLVIAGMLSVQSVHAASLNATSTISVVLTDPNPDITIQIVGTASDPAVADQWSVTGTSLILNLLQNQHTKVRYPGSNPGRLANNQNFSECNLVGSNNDVDFVGPANVTITPNTNACAGSSGGGTSAGSSSPGSPLAPSTPPTSTVITIAGGAAKTALRDVVLTLGATGASHMMIANTADFAGAVFESYATSKQWQLTLGDGVKTVYARFKDTFGNTSAAVSDTIEFDSKAPATPAVPATPATPAVPGVTPAKPATPATPAIASAKSFGEWAAQQGRTRDTKAETSYAKKVASSVKLFRTKDTEGAKEFATGFVVYGISPATVKLGAGERLALVRDGLETLGRVPSAGFLEQLATGQKPMERNLTKEVKQLKEVLPIFEKLLGHKPNFQNPQEDLAWNTIMYRIRFERDLDKERKGILKFTALYGRKPSSPRDWAVVKAWGYALAK